MIPEGFWKGLIAGTLAGVCVGLGGYFLATYPETAGLGSAVFLVVPFCAGFAIAVVTRQPGASWAAGTVAVLASLGMLVAFGKEGLLCALLSLPILAGGLAIGSLAGFLFRRHFAKRSNLSGTTMLLLAVLTPTLIGGSRRLELPGLESPRREPVISSIMVNSRPEVVWENIRSIDRIGVRKPFLMYIGLPVPTRCSLQGAGVGATRTCYFENGTIVETVTEWDPPRSMGLKIDRTNMPGRHWLGFEDAHYELTPLDNGTLVTRTTTFTSKLAPVWYWRYFERLGIDSEHNYILRDLAAHVSR